MHEFLNLLNLIPKSKPTHSPPPPGAPTTPPSPNPKDIPTDAMDKLKSLIASKKKHASEEFGDKKYVKRSELEAVRLKRLREEEEDDRKRKVRNVDVYANERCMRRSTLTIVRFA